MTPLTNKQEWRHLSRKFILSILALGLATLFLWTGKISEEIFRDLVEFSVLAYVATNVAEKWVAKKEPKP